MGWLSGLAKAMGSATATVKAMVMLRVKVKLAAAASPVHPAGPLVVYYTGPKGLRFLLVPDRLHPKISWPKLVH